MMKKSLLDEVSNSIWFCSRCWMCQSVCTVHSVTRKQAHAPMHKVWLVDLARREVLDLSKIARVIYEGCSLCRRCWGYCVSKQDIANIIIKARTEIVNLGKAPEYITEIQSNLKLAKNPMGVKKGTLSAFENTYDEAEVIYFEGCTNTYARPEISKAFLTLLNTVGIKFIVLSGACCGLPAYELGLNKTAFELAKYNLERIKKTRVKNVVSTCPGCVWALKMGYQQLGLTENFNVLHHTEFVNKLIESGVLEIRKSLETSVSYHDSCYLGRYLEIYDQPREILESINKLRLVEMFYNREKSLCCGSGGGLKLTSPKTAIEIAKKTFNEAKRCKIDTLVTACPSCKHSFEQFARIDKLKVKDISEVLISAIDKGENKKRLRNK
ncbi:MAG: (Fe-S)-binding protein [Nitrososphaeria archaeon]